MMLGPCIALHHWLSRDKFSSTEQGCHVGNVGIEISYIPAEHLQVASVIIIVNWP